MWRATVLPIFPEIFPGPLGASHAGKASAKGLWSLATVDIRDFAADKHRMVDDTPAGSGFRMVMKPDVLGRAIDAVAADHRPRLLMSPRGAPLTQARVRDLGYDPRIVATCGGNFEGVGEEGHRGPRPRGGIDRRLRPVGRRDRRPGADRCPVRLIPGVMGKEASTAPGRLFHGPCRTPSVSSRDRKSGRGALSRRC